MNRGSGGASIAVLACGRDAAIVWDQAAAGLSLDEHERDCPHCRAAFEDARGLAVLVQRMAAQRLEPPPSVLDRVMQAVGAGFRPDDVLALPSPHGPAWLSRPAAAAVLRRVVDEMDGLRARSCRIDQAIDQAGDHETVDIAVSVAARFGVDLVSATARVRQMVVAAGEQALGLPVRRVDIDVVDVLEEEV